MYHLLTFSSPWGINDPTEGSRINITDPWLLDTSKFTWQGDGKTKFTATRGNNAIAQTNPDGGKDYLDNPRPDREGLDFAFPYSPSMTNPKEYSNASVTQLFYTANYYHDLLYQLGFDEKAGNFQTNNENEGGKGDDFVILNAQDGSGTDNANFATPPDGKPGRMRMYLWDMGKIKKDCSFEAGVVIHGRFSS